MFRNRRAQAASDAQGRSGVEALEVGAVAALTVLALLIRLPKLGSQSLWLDETLTAHDVSGSLAHLFGALANNELTPPLYFLVAWLWAHVVGSSEVALRSLSVVFGTATVPLAYLIGRKLASRWAGYLAAAFATTS